MKEPEDRMSFLSNTMCLIFTDLALALYDRPVSASSELEVQVRGTIPHASVGILRI